MNLDLMKESIDQNLDWLQVGGPVRELFINEGVNYNVRNF